ncbi:hypothetical protein HK096_007237, partial [Nowakowskiella sp. JEL0078]
MTPLITACIAAAAVALSPLPFSDLPLLLTIQTFMVTAICMIYGLRQDLTGNLSTLLFGFGAGSLMSLGIGSLGYALIQGLKIIPGLGTITAAVLEIPVAVSVTFGLGITVIQIGNKLLTDRLQENPTGIVTLELNSEFRDFFSKNVIRVLGIFKKIEVAKLKEQSTYEELAQEMLQEEEGM